MGRPLLGIYPRKDNPLYGIWQSMRNRCLNPKNKVYANYGGRGVTVCDEWLKDFDCFAQWALENGWQLGLELDKDIKSKELGIDPPVYSPTTCCFVSRKENIHNSRSTKFNESTVHAILKMYDSHEDTFSHRKEIIKVFGLGAKQLGCLLARRGYKQLGRGKAGVLTEDTKKHIIQLREQGLPFNKIAKETQTNYNTCKAWHGKYMRSLRNAV
jgi:hypothetical protein